MKTPLRKKTTPLNKKTPKNEDDPKDEDHPKNEDDPGKMTCTLLEYGAGHIMICGIFCFKHYQSR